MFSSEQELVDKFKESSQGFLGEICQKEINRFFLIDEFNCSDGIADLVLGTFNPSYRPTKKRKSIHLDWVYQLKKISALDEISITEFSNQFLVSESTARKRMSEYVEASFLKRVDGTNFRVVKKYKSDLQFVIAIEAKLKNWNRALSQAYRYKKFSDQSYVLLDKSHSKGALKERELFEKYNIGLIIMDSISYEIVIRPLRNNNKNEIFSSRINEAALATQWLTNSIK